MLWGTNKVTYYDNVTWSNFIGSPEHNIIDITGTAGTVDTSLLSKVIKAMLVQKRSLPARRVRGDRQDRQVHHAACSTENEIFL